MINMSKTLIKSLRLCAVSGAFVGLTACGSTYIEEQNSMAYQPVYPAPVPAQMGFASGAIYNPSQAGLFATDRRASRVGDILTVSFAERFQATKSQNAANTKATDMALSLPNVLGIDRLSTGLATGTTQNFSGTGSAAQSNSLTGQMSVTVARVFDGGNLEIIGQKKLTLNNGDEYIRVRGIVRPEDISRGNEITYDKIASARISYGGRGQITDVQQPRYGQQVADILLPF